MKRKTGKRAISIILTAMMILSVLPRLTLPAKAADTDDMTSNDLAQAWGFNTTQPDDSKARDASGANPWNGHTDSVSTFGMVPRGIDVIGSQISTADDDYHGQNNADRGNINSYDSIAVNTKSEDTKFLSMNHAGTFTDVDGLTDDAETDTRPCATVAADVNGDGVDEIVRYYIDISGGANDGDIQGFDDGKPGYRADFYVEVIDSQTGKRLNTKDSGKVLSVDKSDSDSQNFYIPNSTYYWSSYMQLMVGDYNNDGKKDIAIIVPDKGSSGRNGTLDVLDLNGTSLVQTFSKSCVDYSTYDKENSSNTKFSAYSLTSGDCDNDGIDELIFTDTNDVITEDDQSYLHVIDYNNGAYTETENGSISINHDAMGNVGVTVGDIDNDGLKEIIIGGFMVNKDNQNATYSYTAKDGSGTKNIKYYHEMAMAYEKYDNDQNAYSGFQGFSVFRNDEHTAETCADSNETSYKTYSDRSLDSSRRYRNSSNWTIPIQAVSLTGYVNNKTNDQVFFGNYMYYYDSAKSLFEVYNTDGAVNADTDHVLYHNFEAPNSSIISLTAGSFLTANQNDPPADGKQQLLAEYVRDKNGDTISFEMATYYQKTGDTMAPQRCIKYIATAKSDNFNQMTFYPTICTPNLVGQTEYVQYVGHNFTYTKPEVLNVIASVPYFQDMMDAYPAGSWADPGSTDLEQGGGTSHTNTGSTEVSLGWYFNFHQDISILGIRLFSIEAETDASVSTNYEYSKTIEKESSIQYETSEGQDSVVMVASPLDVYQYRYFQATDGYAKAYPNAKKNDPSTWGVMEVSLPSKPATLVYSVDRYNQLAQTYGLEHIGSNFWTHTLGEPGTYPTSDKQFMNASNVLSCPDTISATTGGSSETSKLSITKTEENAYSFSLNLSAKFGAGAGGIVTGTTVENKTGYGGSTASFSNTTISATINGFPDQTKYNGNLDTTPYGLTTQLYSYTTTFNDKNIMVLDFTVPDYRGLPKRVENFHVTTAREGEIDLAWDVPAVISPKLQPNKYILERYDPYYKVWETVSNGLPAKAGTNTYADTDVYAGESYQYRLISADSTGTITNTVELTASTQKPGQDPPIITQQPLSVAAGVSENVTFSIAAKIPEGSTPTRIYYQWYLSTDSGKTWSSINGAIDKNLTLSAVTQDMNGYQYYCEATRLADNGTHCISKSDIATLTVLDHTPKKYEVDFSSDSNGSITAQQTSGNTSVPVTSGDSLTEESTVKFTASPASGYVVSKWTVNGQTVSGNTDNALVVNNLSTNTTVSVSFTLALYYVGYAEALDVGESSHGTVTAECNGKPLPPLEDTTLPGHSKITFHATPAPGYIVQYWSVNSLDGGSRTNDFTIDSLSQNSTVHVRFKKGSNFKVGVSSSIVNTDLAYADDSGYTVYAGGTTVAPGADIPENAKVDILAKVPTGGMVDSWTIREVDASGKPTGLNYVVGSQPSYTFDNLNSNYQVTINYRIITSKTLTYFIKGGSGTMSAQVVGNAGASGKVGSGGQVQMYQNVQITVAPDPNGLGLSGWLVNGVLDSTKSLTKTVTMDRNTIVQAVIETKPTAKNPAYSMNTNADKTISLDGNSVADDADGDTLTFTAIDNNVTVDPSVAVVKLGSGADSGKLLITSVSAGSTSVKAVVSDDVGNLVTVIIPITVTNNTQTVPSLTGVMNSCAGVDDGKITGLDSTVTYCYKRYGETDTHTITGTTAITGLKPGSYDVYCPARTGYTKSDVSHVTVESNDFAGGTGTAGDPFRITTAAMVDRVRDHMSECFILMNDIDMTDYLSPTGAGYNKGQGFVPSAGGLAGTFNGNGKKISGLVITQPKPANSNDKIRLRNVGLFENIYTTGLVQDLGLDVNITAYGDDVGGIAGQNQGKISRCYVTGQISGEDSDCVGGLVGENLGKIDSCYSTAAISGYNDVGGLVGYLGTEGSGYYQETGTLTNAYYIGHVDLTGETTGLFAGIIVGRMDTGTTAWNIYGYDGASTRNISYYTYSTQGFGSRDGLMKKSTYVSSGWDMDNIWSIDDGKDFPKLRTPVYVSSITLNKTDSALSVGGTGTLTATVGPNNAASKNLAWASSDQQVAVVDNTGLVTAVGAGTADITVSAGDGSGVTAKCTVTVTGTVKATHTVTFKDWNGTELSKAAVNEGAYAVAPSVPTRDGYTFTGWDKTFTNVSADLTVTAQYKANLKKIEITKAPSKLSYASGENLDLTGIEVTGTMTDGSTKVVSVDASNISGFDSSKASTNETLTVTVEGQTTTFVISIKAADNEPGGGTTGGGTTGGGTTGGGTTGGGTTGGGTTGGASSKTYEAVATESDGTSQKLQMTTSGQSALVTVDTGKNKLSIGENKIKIDVPTVTDATRYGVALSADSLTEHTDGRLTMNTALGAITVPANMLSSIADTDGKTAQITINQGNSSTLSDELKRQIGDRPVVQLSLSIDEKQVEWSNPSAPVSVSIPYTPTTEELKNPDSIVVWYIDGSGNAVCMPTGHYDAKTGTVTFTTTHFSQYTVAYHAVSFSDVSDSAWYKDYVNYLAARSIVGGTGDGQFSPDSTITRAQFIAILARMSGDDLSSYKTSAFSDVSTTDWYFAAVQWANKSGVAVGSDGKFDPNASVTREQLATMLYHYDQYKGTVSNTTGATTRKFSDFDSISSWAQDAVQWAMNKGIISGNSDGSFAPAESATRAQTAKMIEVMLQK